MSQHTITRRLEIDAAHRIPGHHGKCRHLHGHRYVVEATCAQEHLQSTGAQQGMIIDFAFLKEEMLELIDAPCDHGLILSVADEALLTLFAPGDPEQARAWFESLRAEVANAGFCATVEPRLGGRLYVIPDPPTAEVLARHWFERLAPRVGARSDQAARLTAVTVWETPNCRACYEGMD
ncbi:6-pyruvoyl trahydropterin synthase family protein [Arhodomonas sp. AD133]|uniref:6-pyruvoyl trahydropterin synthase family protein n=1 Tax=Arhodomonas sp. AD133 TaxID=3415009 RepID=UPI003EBCB8F4